MSGLTCDSFAEVMVPTYAPSAIIPIKGAGSRLWDQQGDEYIDFAGGIATSCLGHAHPRLIGALKEQSEQLWHLSNVMTNKPALSLATKLIEATFAQKVFFSNSGAEANEAALKLARRYACDHHGTQKHEIIAFERSFHGRTLFTVSVGGQAEYRRDFGPLPTGIIHLPFNDLAALEATMSAKTCALIMEPVQGEGGVIPAEREFIEGARQLCDQHDVLLILDEVQTGMGRLGTLYGYQHYGVTPDILTSAKSLGGGFPVAVMLTLDHIADSFSVGTNGTTYGGNLLACKVAGEVLNIVNTPEVLNGVLAKHQRFISGLKQINDKYSIFETIRGTGLLIGCVLSKQYSDQASQFVKAAQQQKLLLLMAGSNVVRLAPSLIIPDEDIIEGLNRFEASISKLKSHLP